MRCIGMAERGLELMLKRVTTREAFGKVLARQGTILADIAKSRIEVNEFIMFVYACFVYLFCVFCVLFVCV
jgi:acyl-CoA dehydrogenase